MPARFNIRMLAVWVTALWALILLSAGAGLYFTRPAGAGGPGGALIGLALSLAAAVALALGLAHWQAARFSKPLAGLLAALNKLAAGDLSQRLDRKAGPAEFEALATAFNAMAAGLSERAAGLAAAHGKAAALNKNYLDLIGFLTHELKGILATGVMQVGSVRGLYLGALNEKQTRALDGAVRSLDYLTMTIRKFLNLVKIEKGELKLNRREIRLKEDVLDHAVQVLLPAATRKGMPIDNHVGAGITVNLDPDLIHAVVCNLISNGVKYGKEGGAIRLEAAPRDGCLRVEVYNDSQPLTADQQAQLFQRFARLDTPATKNEKGTGLGLFISQAIVQLHGGRIWTEAREQGNAFIFEIPK